MTRDLLEQAMEKERIQKERHEAREEKERLAKLGKRPALSKGKDSGRRYNRRWGRSFDQQDGKMTKGKNGAVPVPEGRRSTRSTVKRWV